MQSTLFRVLCAFLHLAPLLRGVILAGLVHCAHCGARMSGFIHRDRYKKKDGTVVENRKPKYNCFQRLRDCDGQALYLADRVDGIVLPPVPGPDETRKNAPNHSSKNGEQKYSFKMIKTESYLGDSMYLVRYSEGVIPVFCLKILEK